MRERRLCLIGYVTGWKQTRVTLVLPRGKFGWRIVRSIFRWEVHLRVVLDFVKSNRICFTMAALPMLRNDQQPLVML